MVVFAKPAKICLVVATLLRGSYEGNTARTGTVLVGCARSENWGNGPTASQKRFVEYPAKIPA